MTRRLLVTGGAGFIGCNFVEHWLAVNPEDRVVVLDALTYAGDRANLAMVEGLSNFRFVEGDICDEALVSGLMSAEGIDTIVHFAAESHVDRSISGPDAFVQTNVVGTHTLLKAARALWLGANIQHRFHHVSTDEVYGSLGPNDPAFTETTAYQPNSPYSASKAASDHLVRAYHETYGLSVTISNCSNNYGPRQHREKLIPTIIHSALNGQRVPIYGDGQNVRDWLYVGDHSRGIEAVIERGVVGEVYNIGGNNELANIDLAEQVCGLVDELIAGQAYWLQRFPHCPASSGQPCSSLIEFVTDRPGHDRRYAINAEKICRELGFSPSPDYRELLRATVDWYCTELAKKTG